MPNFDKTVSFYDVRLIRITAGALLLDVDGEQIFIPKSQIDEQSEITEESEIGHTGELVISRFIAKQKELIE